MLSETALQQVHDYVDEILPGLLRLELKKMTVDEGMLSDRVLRRDEFVRAIERIEQRTNTLELKMYEGFSHIDERFDQMQQQMDERFEQVDRRLEQMQQQMDERFEQVDRRFEQVDRRFEQVDQRFEQVDRRFEQVDQQFRYVRRDIAKLQSGQESLMRRMDQMEVWIKLQLGSLGSEKGTNLEDVFAMALQYGLKNPDIRPESIRLRQKLVDTEGLVFKKGFSTEVDMIAQNGKLTVFEVKARGDKDQVSVFAMKLDLITLQNPDKSVHGVFITPVPDEEVSQ